MSLLNTEQLFFFFFFSMAATSHLGCDLWITRLQHGRFVFWEKSVYESDALMFIHAIHRLNTLSIRLFMWARKARQAEGLGGAGGRGGRHFLPETAALNSDREMKGGGRRKRCKDRDKHWRAEPRCWSCCIWDQRSGFFLSLFFTCPPSRRPQTVARSRLTKAAARRPAPLLLKRQLNKQRNSALTADWVKLAVTLAAGRTSCTGHTAGQRRWCNFLPTQVQLGRLLAGGQTLDSEGTWV